MKQILVLLALVLFALQAQGRPQQQPSDPEPGKPAQCDNSKQTPEAHRCHCMRDQQKCSGLPGDKPADVRMDRTCRTYCREQHCLCAGHGCRS